MAKPMRVLQHEPLSAEAQQLASAYQLGPLKAEYRVRSKRRNKILGILLAIFLGGLFFLGGIVSGTTEGLLILFLVGLLFVVLGLYLAFFPVFYQSWHVYLGTDGFIFTRRGRIDAFHWAQIEAMWQSVTRRYTNGVYTGTTHRYTVKRKDGLKIVLTDRFADVEEIGNRISAEITNYLWPHVFAAYNAGNPITFGPLTVSLQGIGDGLEVLPWSQITDIRMNRGYINVKKADKWLNWSTMRVAKVPNVFVFMTLVSRVLKSQR